MSEPKSKSKQVKRILKGEQEIHHDLFRLELSTTKKNVGWGEEPIWQRVEHKHFFHNVNSDGKPQDKCAPACGHFHYVTVEEVDGELVAKCSEPKMIRRDKRGKKIVVDYVNDNHTHEVTYLESEKVTRRVFSEDAAKAISAIQSRDAQRMKNPCV